VSTVPPVDPPVGPLSGPPVEPPVSADGVRVLGLPGIPELRAGDDLGCLLYEAAVRVGGLEQGDVVVVAQKAVSKAEGRVVDLAGVTPSERAIELAGDDGDPRQLEWILREARTVVRSRPPLVIAETRHGFVCASAGVDASNARGEGTVVLLPVDPDASAHRLRARLVELAGVEIGVVVSDSFGRAWRQGTTDVALGVAGLSPIRDLVGVVDPSGHELASTRIAVADEIAGAAELVMGKTRAVPGAIVRGVVVSGDGTASELVMPLERDLFR
jgi:coenzyme F420-0:L-glutamate ligase/coenzyme F420-1:gamma-L-glutamate ligase